MQAEVLISTADMNRKEWLKARRAGIGGSDVSAIAGLNKWKSPVSVYLEKVGQAPDEDDAGEAAYWGNVMEDIVAQEFTKRSGMKVRRRNAILKHSEYPWMLANVDRLIVGQKEGLECKTASEFMKGEWEGEEIPAAYLLQIQHYMAVTGFKAWWIAVLLGGNKFHYKRIVRDEEIIQYLIEIEKDFWLNHVDAQNPPAFDGSDASVDLLKVLYPQSEPATELNLPVEAEDLVSALDQLTPQIKELETQKKAAENQLKAMLENYETGWIGERRVNWKTVSSSRLDTKKLRTERPDIYEQYVNESTSRRFSVK